MDDGPAAPTKDGDDAAARDTSDQGPAPSSPEAGEPSGRSGADPREATSDTTDASGTASSSDDRWRGLAHRALELWGQTLPYWRKVKEFLWGVINALRETGPVSGATSPAPGPDPGPLTERLDTAVPIRVSGQGRAFNFHIHARCVWSSETLRREALLSYAHYHMPAAIRRLTILAAEHASHFTALRAAELEVELQRALSETGRWGYKVGDTMVTCQPHVWVDVDERVRKAVLPYWEQLVKLDGEFEVDRRRARYADQLGRQWVAVIENLADPAVADEAARTTSENVAGDVRRRMATELKSALQRMEELLRRTLRDGDIF